jgi:hypothetical protein
LGQFYHVPGGLRLPYAGGVGAVQVKATGAPLRVQAIRWQVRRGGRWVAAKPDPGAQITRQATTAVIDQGS